MSSKSSSNSRADGDNNAGRRELLLEFGEQLHSLNTQAWNVRETLDSLLKKFDAIMPSSATIGEVEEFADSCGSDEGDNSHQQTKKQQRSYKEALMTKNGEGQYKHVNSFVNRKGHPASVAYPLMKKAKKTADDLQPAKKPAQYNAEKPSTFYHEWNVDEKKTGIMKTILETITTEGKNFRKLADQQSSSAVIANPSEAKLKKKQQDAPTTTIKKEDKTTVPILLLYHYTGRDIPNDEAFTNALTSVMVADAVVKGDYIQHFTVTDNHGKYLKSYVNLFYGCGNRKKQLQDAKIHPPTWTDARLPTIDDGVELMFCPVPQNQRLSNGLKDGQTIVMQTITVNNKELDHGIPDKEDFGEFFKLLKNSHGIYVVKLATPVTPEKVSYTYFTATTTRRRKSTDGGSSAGLRIGNNTRSSSAEDDGESETDEEMAPRITDSASRSRVYKPREKYINTYNPHEWVTDKDGVNVMIGSSEEDEAVIIPASTKMKMKSTSTSGSSGSSSSSSSSSSTSSSSSSTFTAAATATAPPKRLEQEEQQQAAGDATVKKRSNIRSNISYDDNCSETYARKKTRFSGVEGVAPNGGSSSQPKYNEGDDNTEISINVIDPNCRTAKFLMSGRTNATQQSGSKNDCGSSESLMTNLSRGITSGRSLTATSADAQQDQQHQQQPQQGKRQISLFTSDGTMMATSSSSSMHNSSGGQRHGHYRTSASGDDVRGRLAATNSAAAAAAAAASVRQDGLSYDDIGYLPLQDGRNSKNILSFANESRDEDEEENEEDEDHDEKENDDRQASQDY